MLNPTMPNMTTYEVAQLFVKQMLSISQGRKTNHPHLGVVNSCVTPCENSFEDILKDEGIDYID